MIFELKLSTGKVVTWEGIDASDAATRYVDTFRDAVIVAWRTPGKGIRVWGGQPIVDRPRNQGVDRG